MSYVPVLGFLSNINYPDFITGIEDPSGGSSAHQGRAH
jgi:hypothetical protein